MFEFIAQQQAGIVAQIVSQPTPQHDEYDAEIARRYPHLSPALAARLAAFDRQVGTYGHESVLNAPIVPDRIKARHPLAH